MSDEEKRLCRELEMRWRRKSSGRAGERSPSTLSVLMVEGRGLAPSRLRTTGKNNLLLVRRRHPLTRQAARCVDRDPDNGELAFAALMPSHF